MIMFKRACKRGQSENATLSEILKRAWKIERGVTLKIILEKNSNPYLEQIESHQSYLGGSIIRVLVQVIVTEKQSSRVLSRIYLLGEKSWVAEGDELPRGHSPRKCFEINMRWDAIWCILRHNFEKCYSVRTDLVASGWLFRYRYLYRVTQKFVPLLYKSVFQYDWTW